MSKGSRAPQPMPHPCDQRAALQAHDVIGPLPAPEHLQLPGAQWQQEVRTDFLEGHLPHFGRADVRVGQLLARVM
eukprot:7994241-Pyramimonas_sp.AAC.1